MKRKTILSLIGLVAGGTLTMLVLLVTGGTAGEWHTGGANLCSDCHTMHFSMQHDWAGAAVTPSAPKAGGNWIGTSGPNEFLLKAPVNQLCLSCHDGQSFAPDVLGANSNTAPANGREAGALNDSSLNTWTGHTLGSTDMPPGHDPATNSNGYIYSPGTDGLDCTSCHTQHGLAGVYRNLGPRALGSANLPTYVISATNDTTKDVWINIASQTGTVGSRTAADFNSYYATANINFNRNDTTLTSVNSSNRIDTMCGACHGNFHGSPGNATVGGAAASANVEGFLRHPTSKAVIGVAGAAPYSYGGHSSLTRYTGATTKVKVYSSNSGTTGTNGSFTDATPGCVTCHKAHGNQNPFGLIFLSRAAAAVTEEGGYSASQTPSTMQGYRNLCGQCHSQGSDGTLP